MINESLQKSLEEVLGKHRINLALVVFRDGVNMHIYGFANNEADARAVEVITAAVDAAMQAAKPLINQVILEAIKGNN